MSHIATFGQDVQERFCRYSGQAFTLARFYTQPMALRIKQMRDERGWTQAELAAKSRMSHSQLAMIEAETRPANTLRLNAIAAAFGVPPEALFESGDIDPAILDRLRRLSPEDREVIIRMVDALASKPPQA